MKNFKSEIGCVIVFKMLIYRKIRGALEMTNENVRFLSPFSLHKNTTTFWTCNPFFQLFFLFYILSYQSDSLTSTKNQLSNTNPPESPSKMTKKNVRIRFQDTIVNKRTIRTELL